MKTKTDRSAAMRVALFYLFLIITMSTTTTMAQQKKQLTLEDLNFGGNNYYNMLPKNMYLTWWGEQLMYQDAEEWGSVDVKTGKKTTLGTLDDVNAKLDKEKMVSAMNALFPYPDQPLVLLNNRRIRLLFNWQTKTVEWQCPSAGETESHWNPASKNVAFVKDNQLSVTLADGTTRTLTSDGSREIVYGQAVHRYE
ncbi:MAG: DPP IV N-terminal domain-containing protein, partial [Prevotella sp.]